MVDIAVTGYGLTGYFRGRSTAAVREHHSEGQFEGQT